MHLLYILLVLLLVTRICSAVAVRFKQPALVGELLGGVLIGMGVVGFAGPELDLESLNADATFQGVLDLGVFFLMLMAGVEMHPGDLARVSKKAIPVALFGMFVPLGMGFGLGWWWLPDSDWKFVQSMFLGVALAITAVPVAVKVLKDLGKLQSPVGQVVVAAAVIDDVLSLLLLAVLTSLIATGESLGLAQIGRIAVNVGVFFTLAWLTGRYLLPIAARNLGRLRLEHADFTLLLVFGLGLAVLAELLDMHFLIGAFAAGLLFTRNTVGKATHEDLQKQVETLTLGFLAPVFFASIGIHLDLASLREIPVFVVVLIAVATLGKLLGAGLTARLAGFKGGEALAVGSAMNARGAVEIIVADIALRGGLFDHPVPTPPEIKYLFSAVVIMAIVTTLASPVTLRALLRRSAF
ncbi:MAG: cation:proton antiporter [Xanthomonadales bacterium]|nr:cation:proton antiporter [Xanthomonadales bacterium]